LQGGDKVLFADLDYPSFKEVMGWLQESRQVSAVTLVIPPRTNQEHIYQSYLDAFDANPELKLILLTHVSNQHGLVVPVARIAAEARRRGIDVICDSAQSWGLLDYSVPDLQVDWAGFNLHKWIGAPVGVGALYMQRGSLEKIAPYPGELDPTNSLARTRVHMATANFAAMITVPAALDFHESIGAANKEARLRYLRSLWTDEAVSMSHIELLGGLDEASSTGMGAFRLAGKTSIEHAKHLQQRLENDFGIFTVVRDGLDSGSCVRITPQVFTAADELGQLVSAMKKLA
jgi:selenocysteine lyase/cysteine desulfurase